eukprot:CAMPEP_0194256632 /NCGR_PEP_ID=MMETSP0158-20130606/37112_1 /TAXON_ID=33649 /ORGANISM="Thalassionema nitzschioides, Strain L26-B" /LENGTH=355 /DNA_ID=CAMNT_0038995375 /DNA_START=16 /DNA_END=1080 /DNA_ORIENTATION=+
MVNVRNHASAVKRNGLTPLNIAIIILSLASVVFNFGLLKKNRLELSTGAELLSPVATTTSPPSSLVVEDSNIHYKSSDFAVAKRESLNFFDDTPSAHWKLYKERVKWQAPNYNDYWLPIWDETTGKQRAMFNKGQENEEPDERNRPMGHFYQNHFEPEFSCQHERRIGKRGDGGKWICDPHRIASQKECLVYSVGSNNDFSFEESVHKNIGPHCKIHTFDKGPYMRGARKAHVKYHRYFVGNDSGENVKSIATIVKELGHEGRTIDIFKIDCEGCEWATAKHWFEAPVTIRQVQVELHNAVRKTTPQFFDIMWKHHYVITHKEPNTAYPGAIEYAFLKLAPEFFEGIYRLNASNT